MGVLAAVATVAVTTLVVTAFFGEEAPTRVGAGPFAAFASSAALSLGVASCTATLATLATFTAGVVIGFSPAEALSEFRLAFGDVGERFRAKFWQLLLGTTRGILDHLFSGDVEIGGIVREVTAAAQGIRGRHLDVIPADSHRTSINRGEHLPCNAVLWHGHE